MSMKLVYSHTTDSPFSVIVDILPRDIIWICVDYVGCLLTSTRLLKFDVDECIAEHNI